MKSIIRIAAASVAALALSACETTTSSAPPDPVDPRPPAVNSQQGQATAPRPMQAAPAAAQQNNQQQVIITLHLAQEQPEASLVTVNVGDASLYALPNPVLTQGDIGRVAPVNAQNGGSYLLLEMNQHGIPKLKTVTERARGHYLLLSVAGQLVSVAQIAETINDGRLLVATQGPDHSRAILRMMRGG